MTFDENAWWGDCANTYHEEQKQLVYAARMGLSADWTGAHPPSFDLQERSVLDIGGGPVSLLLKCVNLGSCAVLDPGEFPSWIWERYDAHDIDCMRLPAEDLNPQRRSRDEVWIYNVLQHVEDPELVIEKAMAIGDTIRIFEWVDIEPYEGHPHKLTEADLDAWLGAPGFVTELNESGCVGRAYYGVFSTP